MYMRYYDGYPSDTFGADGEAIIPSAVHGDSLEMLSTEEEKPAENTQECENQSVQTAESQAMSAPQPQISGFLPGGGFLSSLRSDDIILIALLIILMTENSDDFLMPIVIGALLLGR